MIRLPLTRSGGRHEGGEEGGKDDQAIGEGPDAEEEDRRGETREVVMVAITAWMAAIKHDTVKATIANIR